MNVIVDDARGPEEGGLDAAIGEWARSVLASEGLPEETELGVELVSVDAIQVLNREHRGIDLPTDVISFPLFEGKDELLEEAKKLPQEMPLTIGDVVLCPEVAAADAESAGAVLQDQLCWLLIHGLLHLLGYDHEGESESERDRAHEMREQERRYLAILRPAS